MAVKGLLAASDTGVLSYAAGEVILFPGTAKEIYHVRSGLIRIYMVDDKGDRITLRYVKPGGYFGEEALANLPRRYFAEAGAASSIEIISLATLGEYRDLAAYLAEIIGCLNASLHHRASKRLKARIAVQLLDLQDSALATKGALGDPVILITHDDLAAAVGSMREAVSRVVGELAREGVIATGYAKITLTDPPKLAEIARR